MHSMWFGETRRSHSPSLQRPPSCLALTEGGPATRDRGARGVFAVLKRDGVIFNSIRKYIPL